MPLRYAIILLLGLFLGGAEGPAFALGSQPTPLAATGLSSPGGGDYWILSRPFARGAFLVFTAKLSEDGTEAVFLYDGAQLSRALVAGEKARTDGAAFESFGPVAVNRQGQIAFVARLDNGVRGVFTWEQGEVSQVAVTGKSLDASLEIVDFLDLDVGDLGEVVFSAFVAGGRGPAALIRAGRGALSVLAQSGDAVAASWIELPRDIRIGVFGEIFFVNFHKVGPVSQFAPRELVRVAAEGLISRIAGAGDQASNTGRSIEFGAGGRGIRSYGAASDGSVLLVADVTPVELLHAGQPARQRVFKWEPEAELTEIDLPSYDRLTGVAVSAGRIFLAAEEWGADGTDSTAILEVDAASSRVTTVDLPAPALRNSSVDGWTAADETLFVLVRSSKPGVIMDSIFERPFPGRGKER